MNVEGEGFTFENALLGYEKRRVEALFDPIRFDALFDFTNKLLASRPIESTPVDDPLSAETTLIAQIGSRGLRTAYELAHGVDRLAYTPNTEDPEKAERLTYGESLLPGTNTIETFIDAPLLYPQLFSGELNRHALERARLLGDTMMDEMFRTIGQDAYGMAELGGEAPAPRQSRGGGAASAPEPSFTL